MKARLMILIAAAAVLAVYFAMRTSAPASLHDLPDNPDVTPAEHDHMRLLQTALEQRSLPGEEPPEEAEVSVRVEVDPTESKNRLYLYISEAHGFYVETFDIIVYHLSQDESTGETTRTVVLTAFLNFYLKANETKEYCLELVPPEMDLIDDDLGTSENWEAEVVRYGRARMQNPDPLPPLEEVSRCD